MLYVTCCVPSEYGIVVPMKDDRKAFERERIIRIREQGKNKELIRRADAFIVSASQAKYTYNFTWFGVPIFQHPEDIIALQEIIFRVKPEVIVDVGTARGGTAIFYASLLKLIGGGRVISVDIDIRVHNRDTIRRHPLARLVDLVEGSSTDPTTVAKVKRLIRGKKPVLISLDSLHSGTHVAGELALYSKLVTRGSYLVVCDTVLKKLPRSTYPKDHATRPWSEKDNPGTAVDKFLRKNKRFIVDTDIDHKLLISCAAGGYLKRVR